MKSSALRRWLREERGRENAEALAAGPDIGGDFGPRTPIIVGDWSAALEGAFRVDRDDVPRMTFAEAAKIAEELGTPWPSLRPGHKLIDTGPSFVPAPTVTSMVVHSSRVAWARSFYPGVEIEIDDDRAEDAVTIKVTPPGYAEHIACTIGFNNPEAPKT